MKRLIANFNDESKIFDLLSFKHLRNCFKDKVENFCRFEEHDGFTEWEIDNWDGIIDTFINYAVKEKSIDKSLAKEIVDKYIDAVMNEIKKYFEFYFKYE